MAWTRIIISVVAVLLLFAICAKCQLTFSPDWGKRSLAGNVGTISTAGNFFEPSQGNCKTSKEMLLEIFRFVQSEAQLYLDCKHRE